MAIEPKKMALLRIKEILEQRTDENHPLKQEEIVSILQSDYGIFVDRRAVSRNLKLLEEADVDIVYTRKGCFLGERVFEDAELHLLIESVLFSRHITPKRSKLLIERLCSLSSRYFKSYVKHVHTVDEQSKTENNTLFYSISMVDEAIEKGHQVTFDFNRYGIDKKLHKTASHKVSPYGLILKNQRYYLIGRNEKYENVVFFRMDHITNMAITEDKVTPVRSNRGYENGIDYKRFSSAMPYMYNDEPVFIELLTDESMADEIIQWFGRENVNFLKKEDKVQVLLTASPQAMEFWCLQYLGCVEVVSPASLREKIKEDIRKAVGQYSL